MENKVIDTPYEDRGCYNCRYYKLNNAIGLYYCRIQDCFAAKNKWCSEWSMQYRLYEFEN